MHTPHLPLKEKKTPPGLVKSSYMHGLQQQVNLLDPWQHILKINLIVFSLCLLICFVAPDNFSQETPTELKQDSFPWFTE